MSRLADAVIALYRSHASSWDAARRAGAWNDRGWHEAFAAELPPGAHVLDLGCGGGAPVAEFLAGQGLRVTGVDTATQLVALARARLPDQEWIEADMRGLALGRRFDGILAWDSFFHLRHAAQRAMLAVFDAHASDKAVLMFNTGPEHGQAISTNTFAGEQLYHASLAPEEYRGLLTQHGFRVLRHAANDWENGGGRTVWLCKRA